MMRGTGIAARKKSKWKVPAGTVAIGWVIGALLMPSNLGAQTPPQTIDFSIPAAPLSQALAAFGRQSGLQVSYLANVSSGKASPGISGRVTREEALMRVLSGTGLSWSFTNASTVTIAGRANEEGESSADDGTAILDLIVVTARNGRPADAPYETAAPNSYISGEAIERFRGSSAADMFRGTPGVMSGEARNGAGAIDVNVRGMQGMGRVAVKVDDAENQVTVYQGYQGISNRTFVDPDLLAGVDILKGSDAASSGIAGTVAMRTVDAADIVKEGKVFGVQLKGGVGGNSTKPNPGARAGYGITNVLEGYPTVTSSNDGMDRTGLLEPTQGSGSAIAAVKTENVDLLAAYAYRKRGNYYAGENGPEAKPVHIGRQPFCYPNGECPFNYYDFVVNGGLANYRAGEEVLNTELETESWLAKGTLRLDDGHRFKLGLTGYRSEAGDQLASQFATDTSRATQQAQTTGVKLDTGTLHYYWQPDSNPLIDAKANLWVSNLEQRNPIRLRRWNVKPSDFGLSDDFRVGSDSLLWGGEIANTSSLTSDYGPIKLSYGATYKNEDTRPSDYTEELEGIKLREGNRQEAAGYGKLSWEATDWLTLNGALRYQHYWSEDRSPPQDIPYDDTHGQSLSGGGFSPSLGVTIEPIKGTQLYANYSNTLRSPSIMESLTGFSTWFNTELEPERSSNWEIGANLVRDGVLTSGDRGMLKLGYFDWTVKDYIAREWTTVDLDTIIINTMLVYNIHQAHFSGLELSGRYEIGGLSAELAANYYLDVEFCRTADTCDDRSLYADYATNQVPPEYSVSLAVAQKLLDDSVTIGGRISHVGPRAIEHGQVTGQGLSQFISLVDWEPYTLVDVFAEYKVNENFTVSARIENLTDQFYVDSLSLVQQPGPGRTFYLSLTSRF